MLLTLECREVNGWPMVFPKPPVVQGGDKLRLENYGTILNNSLIQFAKFQRDATREAREGRKPKTSTTFKDLMLQSLLGKPIRDYVNDKVAEKTVELEARIKELEAKLESLNG